MKLTLPDGSIISSSFAVFVGKLQLSPWRPSKQKALSAFKRTKHDQNNPHLHLVTRVRTMKPKTGTPAVAVVPSAPSQ